MTSDVAVLERPLGREARVFLASFLVLFLEIALIRWMPAYIRLLAYFSNFILLASFLGIGVGCLLAPSRRRLFVWFPLLQAVVIGAAYFFRLEVAVQSTGSIYFTSGTAAPVVVVESTMLLPLVFVIVAALFATLAQRMGTRDGRAAAAARLHDQPRRQPCRRGRVCRDLVAPALADVVVRRRLRRGAAAPADGGSRVPSKIRRAPAARSSAVNVGLSR